MVNFFRIWLEGGSSTLIHGLSLFILPDLLEFSSTFGTQPLRVGSYVLNQLLTPTKTSPCLFHDVLKFVALL